MPASERLYYSDSFLREFTGSVTEARALESRDGVIAWQVALDRSAFYPTSGGQPFDTGVLTASSKSGTEFDIQVDQVEEDEHGTVWHFVRSELAAGDRVTGRIDWERRFDHMQQHTGQHLLSAVFLRELHAPTVSFHLGESSSTIDVACPPPAHHSLERIERIANEIIGKDRAVSERYASRAEADAMLAAGELRKLPDREGTIRLIDIADLDRNACGGTHVRSTGQIGGLLVRSVEKVTRGARIEFVCGLRAIRRARADAAILAETAAQLSVGASELAEAVKRLLGEGKAGARDRQKLREELAAFHGAKLASETPLEDGLRLVVRAIKDRDRDYVRLLASRTASSASSTIAIFTAKEAEPARVFLARSPDLHFDCGRVLREALTGLGLRGGGSADLAQGDVPAEHEAALTRSLIDAIRSATALTHNTP
jgi:alanyl-tRNA synthetase